MTEMVTSGSMSGERKRSDGLLGESGNERRRSQLAPPALDTAAPPSTLQRLVGTIRRECLQGGNERFARH